MKRFVIHYRSVLLLVLGTLALGQTGPCGAGAGPVTSGGDLRGVWRATYFDSTVGNTTVDLVLGFDGNFSEEYTSSSSLTMISGPYQIDAAGVPGLLRLNTTQWYPTQFCGPLGCTPITLPSESWDYSFVDNNHVVFTPADGCTVGVDPGCIELDYTRQ